MLLVGWVELTCGALFPFQVWPLELDSVRTSICPFRKDPRAHRNLWRATRLQLLHPLGWQLEAPCSLTAEATLCWQALGGGPCQSLVPPLPRENVTVNKAHDFPLLKGHPNLCVQVRRGRRSTVLGGRTPHTPRQPQTRHCLLDPLYSWNKVVMGFLFRSSSIYFSSAWDPGQVT